jgi:hypothetical protein
VQRAVPVSPYLVIVPALRLGKPQFSDARFAAEKAKIGDIERKVAIGDARQRNCTWTIDARRRSQQRFRTESLSALASPQCHPIVYTPPAGRIGECTHRDEKVGDLAVDDDGPGIPAADRKKVFERFMRWCASEVNSSADSGGSGLELAIVSALLLHTMAKSGWRRPSRDVA